LAARFGIAPMTVQNALKVLRDGGVVDSRQGAGVFVRGDVLRLTPAYRAHDGETVMCESCGGLVADQQVHTDWHRRSRG
jgi:DNA-binding GntR family transcriptional regulator